MKKIIPFLVYLPIAAMELSVVEEGKAHGTLSVDTVTHIHYTAPDLENDHIAQLIKSYLPGSNGNVTKHVSPLLSTKIKRSSGNCFEDENRLKQLMAEAIDEALELKEKELIHKDSIIAQNEIRIARINRNKKIALAVVSGCTAIITCFITAVITLVPTETACNT